MRRRPARIAPWLGAAIVLLLSPAAEIGAGGKPRSREPRAGAVSLASAPPQTVELALPFEGAWGVVQGTDDDETHFGYAAFALDFAPAVRLDRQPKPARLEDFPCFGRPVLAPADGRVLLARDGGHDGPPWKKLRRQPGNFVIIEHAPGEYTEFRHLQRGSVRHAPGAAVRRGDVIGRCGNSGNAETPHLHVGFLGSVDPIATRPVRFARYEVLGPGGIWRPGDGLPKKGEIVRPAAPDAGS